MHFHIPETNNIPDLSALDAPIILNAILNKVFGRRGPSGYPAIAFHSGFIMTMDNAIFEYESARKCLDEAIARNHRWTNYFRCLAHFEMCINSIKRAKGFLEGLKGCLQAPQIERTLNSIESHLNNLRKIRNTIEHIDEKIRKGEVQKGDPVVLAIADDEKSIQISSHRITFNQLELVIRNLHTLAENLAEYSEIS